MSDLPRLPARTPDPRALEVYADRVEQAPKTTVEAILASAGGPTAPDIEALIARVVTKRREPKKVLEVISALFHLGRLEVGAARSAEGVAVAVYGTPEFLNPLRRGDWLNIDPALVRTGGTP